MFDTTTLPNGLEIITSEMPYMESVSIGVWIGMGGRYEDRDNNGVSHFLEHMLFKGTATRDAKKLKQEIEGVGGHFNGFTGEELTCYLVRVPSAYVSLGLDILSDMVLNATLDDTEIEKERGVIFEEIKMYKDQPSSYVHEILASAMWPDHPLGMPLAGIEESVRSLDRRSIMAIKEKYYQPANIVVVATGRLSTSQFVPLVKKFFIQASKRPLVPYKKFIRSQTGKGFSTLYKETEQTNIAMGFHCYGRRDAERYALNLLNIIIGGNMSSRLFEELREKRGLCYDISSSVKKFEETGAFLIHAGVDHSQVKATLQAIIEELSLIKKEPVGDNELRRAKEYYKGQLVLMLEETSSRMLWAGDKVVTERALPDVDAIIRALEKVSSRELQRIAVDVFRPEIMNVASIGPESVLSRIPFDELTGGL
ncbi:MAG: pitrilysin family protein [Candidatus Omnitrophica bacterium]|nr:pitrilysin family protein [Candidatus Omnitrophota bacterium]